MGDTPVSQDLFFRVVEDLKADSRIRHANLRDDIQHGFTQLSARFDAHVEEDQAVEHRVTLLEGKEQQRTERDQRRRPWLLALIPYLAFTLWDSLKHLLGWSR